MAIPMKLAVIGSRTLCPDLGHFIEEIPDVTLIVSGGAKGIDTQAEAYARKRGIAVKIIRPDYEAFGRVAPLVRDRQIVEEADMVLAIWDGSSRGTSYTVNYARKTGKPVKLFKLKGES